MRFCCSCGTARRFCHVTLKYLSPVGCHNPFRVWTPQLSPLNPQGFNSTCGGQNPISTLMVITNNWEYDIYIIVYIYIYTYIHTVTVTVYVQLEGRALSSPKQGFHVRNSARVWRTLSVCPKDPGPRVRAPAPLRALGRSPSSPGGAAIFRDYESYPLVNIIHGIQWVLYGFIVV